MLHYYARFQIMYKNIMISKIFFLCFKKEDLSLHFIFLTIKIVQMSKMFLLTAMFF